MSDNYLPGIPMIAPLPSSPDTDPLLLDPGAVVLAHSLRDNGTKAKLVALYTPDTLQAATINELQVRTSLANISKIRPYRKSC